MQQLENYKKTNINANQDEKMRIIGSYEATIKNMKEENSKLFNEKMKYQNDFDKINQVSH